MKKRKELESDFELNLAPIIDCFTVLITYLLVSASFISFGIISVAIVATAESEEVVKNPTVSVTIGLKENHDIVVQTERDGQKLDLGNIPNQSGHSDYNAYVAYLRNLRGKYNGVETMLLASDDTIEYKELVKLIEYSKGIFPNVALRTESLSVLKL